MINKRQVGFGGVYASLYEYAQKRVVKQTPFAEAQVLTVNANYTLIPSTILAGTIALGTTSLESGGVVAAALVGAVGTGANTTIADSIGNIANLVRIRNASTHDPISVGDREVFGLIQAASTVVDGDAIGGVGSENIQISFVYIAADGTLTLTAVNTTVEFTVNKMFTIENLPTYEVQSSAVAPDMVAPTGASLKVANYVVTTGFIEDEEVDLVTGAGETAGVATPSGDAAGTATAILAASYATNNNVQFLLNGVELLKGTDVVVLVNGTAEFNIVLDIGDVFTVKYMA
jgi:hypothetical protein